MKENKYLQHCKYILPKKIIFMNMKNEVCTNENKNSTNLSAEKLKFQYFHVQNNETAIIYNLAFFYAYYSKFKRMI